MPMQRWMQSAAGGTSQRLKPACATVRSRSRIPAPGVETRAAPSSVAKFSSLRLAVRASPPPAIPILRPCGQRVLADPSLSTCARIEKRIPKVANPSKAILSRRGYCNATYYEQLDPAHAERVNVGRANKCNWNASCDLYWQMVGCEEPQMRNANIR